MGLLVYAHGAENLHVSGSSEAVTCRLRQDKACG